MVRRTVGPGDPILSNLNARWFNEQQRMMNKHSPQKRRRDIDNDPESTLFVLDETNPTEVGWLEPVVITGAQFDPGTDASDPIKARVIAKCKKPASGVDITDDNWGISLSPVMATMTGRMVLQGLVWAKFTKTDSAHKYVYLDTTTYTLKSRANGPARIVSHTITSGSDGYGLIRMGMGGAANTKIFRSASAVPARTGSSSPYTMGSISATEWEVVDVSGTIKLQSTVRTENVYNIDPKSIPANTFLRTTLVNGYNIVEAITKDIRVSTYDFQLTYSPENAGWVNWATGGPCLP